MPGYVKSLPTTGELLELAVRYHQSGALQEAESLYRQILQADPVHSDSLHLLGFLEHQTGHTDLALSLIRQAIALSPSAALFHSNLGVVLIVQGQFEAAVHSFKEALRLKPDHPSARWNLSLLKLQKGDFAAAWPDYEWRWRLAGWVESHVDRPLWDGASLDGRTILLYPEQGLGDTIQFIRYAPLVKERGGTVLFECPPSLESLLTGVAGVDQFVVAGTPLPPFDVRAPLLSLPGIFGTTLATIPAAIPYLRADGRLVEYWRQELEPLRGFRIAIAWQGSPTHELDRWRSLPLTSFEALARLDGIRLLSVQKGPGADQIATLAGRFDVIDLSNRLDREGAFTDTAAVLKNVDLVVTTDSAVAHLAGALGVPVWVALPLCPDWRWQLERSDSPWYPTMRLFRQSRLGDWGEVFERIAAQVRGLIGQPSGYVASTPTTGELLELAMRCHRNGGLQQAESLYRQILDADPVHADALHLLGSLEHQTGHSDVGISLIRQAIALNPSAPLFHTNLAVVLIVQGQFEEAARSFEEALRLKPDDPPARWNLSLLKLQKGDFAAAWPDYECRLKLPGGVQSYVDRPLWDGASLDGRTILLYPEQGLGDTIQFIRYAPLVKERGGTVLFECPPSLAPLLTGVAGVDQFVAAGTPLPPFDVRAPGNLLEIGSNSPSGTPLPPFDVRAPLMSLPGIFGTTLATIPAAIPYLSANSRLVEYWRQELEPLRGFRIAIAWQGSPTHELDRWRSLPLTSFEALARLDGIRLLSVQKGPGVDQIATLAGRFDVIDLSDRLDREGAFTDTAAVLKNVDLVVTTDSAVAHLAGALGVPVWVALPLCPDWRWQLERSDSPWYPTMRLFRQSRLGDWGEVLGRIAAQVRGLIGTMHRA